MRILVADQNALLLAAITATFGPHCDLVTATRRDVCITQLEQHKFDVVIACDKLSDYTGLELLSEVGAISPDTLLIFAADPKRLNQLGKRLAVFGLFAVLAYPITPQKLLDILKRARQSLRTPKKPKVRHVVLESEWDTGVRLGLVEKDLQAQAEAAGRAGHDDWPNEAEVAHADPGADPGVEADDFVFSGPPVVSPVSEPSPPARGENRARTFEATPVASRAAPGASARSADAGEVIEYEVKPVVLALTHDTGTIACDDEFIFAASESVPVSAGAAAAELIEVEAGADPVPLEPEPSIDDFCSNDPIFDVPEPPRWAEDGAANDTAYEPKPAARSYRKPGSSEASSSTRGKQSSETPASLAYGQYAAQGGEAKATAAYSTGSATDTRSGPDTRSATGARGGRAAGVSASRASDNTSPSSNTNSSNNASQSNNTSPSTGTSSLQAKSSEAGKAGGKATQAPSPKARPQRRTRTQAVPSEAQRAAFERALARRNAARDAGTTGPTNGKARQGTKGGARSEPTIQAGSMDSLFAGAPAAQRPSKSLSELARMATHKRPLSARAPNLNKSARPKRAVYAVGSGLAAVVILAVISFELHRNSSQPEQHVAQVQATSTQLFSSRTMMLDNNQGTGVPQFGPPIQQAEATPDAPPPNMPEAQSFDPNTAPEDPPPPPAVDQPGPMEPPSEDVHTGPPLGMIQEDGSTDPQ